MLLSRICEEYHCRPSEAWAELNQDPEHWATRILPVRSYERAKQVVDQVREKKDLPDSPAIDEVQRIAIELVKERRARAAAEKAAAVQTVCTPGG